MKNLHLIPTDKPSSLYILGNNELKLRYTIDLPIDSDIAVNQHIYITSDEEIEEGDWFYVKTPNIYGGNVVARCLSFGKHCWSENILTATTDEKGYHPSHCVKIIMTTDQDLIKDGVQAIDDEFLEWFVKNPSCEEVDINRDWGYPKIIIPKEEPNKTHYLDEIPNTNKEVVLKMFEAAIPKLEPKRETFEEAAEKEYPIKIESIMEGYHDVNSYQRNAFIKGAKLAQERMYSEEEVLVILDKFLTAMIKGEKTGLLEKWFKQFKKK